MGTWLVVGLGNPGAEYASNRHNIGFMVVDQLGTALGASFRSRLNAQLADVSDGTEKLVLVKPQQFMNVSGTATQAAATFYKVAPASLIVVHDELDLPYEKLRIKIGGGHGGHNGLRSIGEHLGADYIRVRCGVGKPATAGDRDRVVSHVLGNFSKEEQKSLPIFIAEAVQAVRTIIAKGALAAMNQFNQGAKN